MPERLTTRQIGSISRTLLLPSEHQGTIRLRHQLAKDGCKESQLALAKSLLTNPISNLEEKNFNSCLAIYWLLQAAEKGQEEALVLLKDCADAGVGVTARNSIEIEKCLKYSENDIISRKVAFAIFRAIMSDTEDIVSEERFREKIEKILQEDDKDVFTLQDEEEILRSEAVQKNPEDINKGHVSFSEVVSSVQTCLEGNVPIVSLKHVAQYEEYKKWLLSKYITIIWRLVLQSTEDLIRNFTSLAMVYALLFFYILLRFVSTFSTPGTEMYSFVSNCKLFIVTLLCLSSLLSSTCFVVSISLGIENVKKWLHLIKLFEPNAKSAEAEKKYLAKATYPSVTFLVLSIFYLMLLPSNSLLQAFGDIGVLCIFLMIIVDRTISHERYYVNISFILNMVTCLYKYNVFQNALPASFSNINFAIMYEIGKQYEINLSFISCLTLPFVLPYLYTKMAFANDHKGFYFILLPHLMSLSWMNLACLHLADVDSSLLVFSLCKWILIMILSHYIGAVPSLLLFILLKTVLVSGTYSFYLFLIVPVFGISYLGSVFFTRKFKISNENKYWSLFTFVAILVICYQTVLPPTEGVVSSPVLPWDKYQAHCHHSAWYRTNPADVQISCLPFKGRKISIEGTVTSIEVINVKNSLQTIANILPDAVYDLFVCALGKRYTFCDAQDVPQSEREYCLLYETLNISHCHLHNWDEYEYEIVMEVSTRTSPEVVLFADHACSPFIRGLKEGDTLHVVGSLVSNTGGLLPKFILEKAECSSCYLNTVCKKSLDTPKTNVALSMKNVVRFYLSPFIQFK